MREGGGGRGKRGCERWEECIVKARLHCTNLTSSNRFNVVCLVHTVNTLSQTFRPQTTSKGGLNWCEPFWL